MIQAKNLPSIPIQKLAPSFITLLGLCLGITSIRYAFDEKWHIAVALIIIAAFFDGLDGRLARMLNATSVFGAQLDSLADVVSFGVAPPVILYLWSLHDIPYKGVGWAVVLFYITCSAIRLARFNSNLDNPKEKIKSKAYFTGMPITSAAIMALLPMMMHFDLTPNIFSHWFIAAYIPIVGLMMISIIPTYSFKTLHVDKRYISALLLIASLVIAGVILEPWKILPLLGLIYALLIPVSAYSYYRFNK